MENPLKSVMELPGPVQAVLMLSSAAGLGALVMAMQQNSGTWRIIAILIIGVVVAMVLFKVALSLWDKRKSSPFAQRILGAANTRGTNDPNQKAKLDDVRNKFEEGMRVFKSAGKDVYGLPWYLVVGVPGSGKTEMIRRSNVGFPQDLNEPRQGLGGTHNMNWWFTNEAVVLDTAGRMFMEEGGDGNNTEWKEFLKMLRQGRVNCPINGLLLVIPAESLIEHDAKKIEEYASTIRRQLDSVQRTLEVRFPVTVLITKCDRIVGFKEFFDSIPDTQMQQQMLGWSNPASLDEPFDPAQLDAHMKGVREKLLKRRAGLLQNPVHTVDPNDRRIDQIDEMFELPANLMQVVPKLRQYLEVIFSTGQWSMRPLFLRGIYFTSALRKGNALDVALAKALGIDVAQLSDGREREEDKAFFLRDVFVGKVFKESGLVTNAAHVGQSIARQRKLIIGTALVGALVVGAAALLGASGYRSSLGRITPTWSGAAQGSDINSAAKWPLFEREKDTNKLTYVGKLPVGDVGVLSDEDTTRSGALRQLGDATAMFADPWAAKPALWLRGITAADFRQSQVRAHRAIVERQLLVPLLDEVRAKLLKERNWDMAAVNAMAQLIRITTLFEGATPRNSKAPKDGEPLINVEHLVAYALGDTNPFKASTDPELVRLQGAVAKAYPAEFPDKVDLESSPLANALFRGNRDQSLEELVGALNRMREDLKSNVPADTRLAKLRSLMSELKAFSDIEKTNADKLAWLGSAAAPGVEPDAKKTIAGYTAFADDFRKKRDELSTRAQAAMLIVSSNFKMEELARPSLLSELQEQWRLEVDKRLASLTDQVRTPPAAPVEGAVATAPTRLVRLDKLFDPQDNNNLTQSVKLAVESASKNDSALLKEVGPFMAALPKQGTLPADVKPEDLFFEVTRGAYVQAALALEDAEKFPQAPKANESSIIAQAKSLREKFSKNRAEVWQRDVEAPRQWLPASPDGERRREESLSALRKVRDLSELRATYGLADAVLKDPMWASTETFEAGIREQWVRMLEDAKLNSDSKVTAHERLPRVPLTVLDTQTGTPIRGEFHYVAVDPVVKSWSELRDLAVPKTAGALPQMVDAAAMKDRFQTAPAVQTFDAYAKRYVAYWKKIADGTAMPSEFTVSDLTDFDESRATEVSDRIKKLKDQLLIAAKVFDASMSKESDSLVKQVNRDYAAIDADAALPQFLTVSKNWRDIISKGDAQAKTLVREALTKNTFATRFAPGFGVTDDKYLKYQDEFILRSLSLVAGGQDSVATAWNQLTGAFKGVPIAKGQGLPSLTLDDVKKAAAAAELLDRSGGSGASSELGSNLPTALQNRVKEVFGRNYLEKDETRAWLAGVKSVAAALGDGSARIEFELDGISNTGADGVRLAADVYTVGQLWINDEFKDSKNIKTGGVISSVISLPAPSKIEIRLSLANQNTQITAPDDVVVLSTGSGDWNILAAILTAPQSRLKINDASSGSVFIVSQKGASGAWFKYSLFPKSLPLQNDWPQAQRWPEQ